ncbi:hypothetical protein ABKN59_005651 [Abortiporus biennis]
MESLNLNMLASSLPNSNLANAEKDLVNNFKAAALSLTTLYRSSRRTSKRAYNAGYATACQDLLLMIQQGVSTGNESEMTIGRIMDYIEARLEAIKCREEEEDEDEEKERARSTPTPATDAQAQQPTSSVAKVPNTISAKAPQVVSAPLTPHSPSTFTSNRASTLAPLSPTPTSSVSVSSISAPLRSSSAPIPLPVQRMSKSRFSSATLMNAKESAVPSTTSFGFSTAPKPQNVAMTMGFPEVSIGMKRRHNAMSVEASAASSSTANTRRRTRSSRGSPLANVNVQDQNMLTGQVDDMDVEEDGRERKRVARR